MGDGVAKMETPAFMPGRTSIAFMTPHPEPHVTSRWEEKTENSVYFEKRNTGTVESGNGREPPVASFTYSEQEDYQVSGLKADDGTFLIGKKVILDMSSSYDPDGEIKDWYFTAKGRYLEQDTAE